MFYDVIVIGLGAMGSAAAHRLAARGARVLGLERYSAAHNQGSSHGGSRIIRQSYFEDPAYVPLLRRAYELWAEVEAETGRDLLTLTGGVYIGPPDSLTYAGSLRSARQWNLPHETLDAAEIRRRFPTLSPGEDLVGLYEERAGLVRPEAGVAAQLDLAARHGAELRFGEPVLEWSAASTGPVRVRTATGSYAADRLVICPGAWAPELLAGLGVPLEVERQVMYWFQPADIAAFTPDRQPIYIWEDAAGTQIYGFPAIDGPDGGVKVAMFRGGEICTAATLDRAVRPAEVAAVRDHLAARLPAAAGAFLRGAVCVYTNTPDEHFVIARHPAHDRVTVACGFSGHGYKFSPVVGEILADLSSAGETRHDVALFAATRGFPRGWRRPRAE